MATNEREYYWIRSNILLRNNAEECDDGRMNGSSHDTNSRDSNNDNGQYSSPSRLNSLRSSNSNHAGASPLAKLMKRNSMRAITREYWGWIRALVLSRSSSINNDKNSNILSSSKHSQEGTVELLLFDPDHDRNFGMHMKKVVISMSHLQNEEFAVRMNNWAVSEMETMLFADEEEEENQNHAPDDVMKLVHLHEPAIVHALRRRYDADKIYTHTGPILLALNPFKDCQYLYGEDVMLQYMAKAKRRLGENVSVETDSLPPHVFEIADRAFHTMMQSIYDFNLAPTRMPHASPKADQCILVSGESGAGKTVSANHIMQYLAFLSHQHNSNKVTYSSPDMQNKGINRSGAVIEEQLLYSTHILESFGNARTIRNDNSSRFGKFTEIGFTNKGRLVGAAIETYLLEKVRILLQAPGERNYHIFYQILSGSSASEREKYFLDDMSPVDFAITSRSGTYDRRDGVSDINTYVQLRTAINGMGFSFEEQSDIIGVCCAVLHLSNVTFLAVTDDHSQVDSSNRFLNPMLSLLGLKLDDFNKALTTFSIEVGVAQEGETKHFVRSLSREKAFKGLGALLKATYAALFDLIVERIRGIIKTSNTDNHTGPLSYIGVLDIFGFEIFEENSFEQLCINYCNETLQRQFNDFVLKYEQVEYEEEGIDWSYISFPDNQDVIDLIDKRGSGILEILDDQCKTVGTTDKTFWHDMHTKCKNHVRFDASFLQIGSRKFEIIHYAGSVEYGTDTFLEKNLDELPREAADLLRSSSRPLVSSLAMFMKTNIKKSMDTKLIHRASSSKPSTVSAQFIQQLKELRSKIDSAAPHYIRCLKPNNDFIPNKFEDVLVENQLRYAGVLEAVRVSRAGFAQRFSIPNFIDRYDILVANNPSRLDQSTNRQICTFIVNTMAEQIVFSRHDQPPSDSLTEGKSRSFAADAGLQVGKTKVFVSRDAFKVLESLRQKLFDNAAIIIQTPARVFVQRLRYLKTVQAVKIIHRYMKIFLKIIGKRREDAIIHLAIWSQKTARGIFARKKYSKVVSDRQNKYIVLRNKSAIIVQCAVRVFLSKQHIAMLRSQAKDVDFIIRERDALKKEVLELRRQLSERGAIFEYDINELTMILREIKKQAVQLETMIKTDCCNRSNNAVTSANVKLDQEKSAILSEELASLKDELNSITFISENALISAEIERQKVNSLQMTLDHLKNISPAFEQEINIEENSKREELEEYRRKFRARSSPSKSEKLFDKKDYSIVSSATVVRLVNRLEQIIANGNGDQSLEHIDVELRKEDDDVDTNVKTQYKDLINVRNRMYEKLSALDDSFLSNSVGHKVDDISLDASALITNHNVIHENEVKGEKKESFWNRYKCCSRANIFDLDSSYHA